MRGLVTCFLAVFPCVCSVGCMLYGAGDNILVATVYTMLKQVFAAQDHLIAPAIAAFKCMQSIGSAVAFLYGNNIDLEYQVIILIVLLCVSLVTSCVAERRFNELG